MSSDWVEVQIRSALDAGGVLGLLDDPSVPGAWQDDRTIHLYWPSHHWSSDHLVHLRQTLRRLTEQGMAQPLATSTRRTLLASGLLVDQRDEIAGTFARAGLYRGREREREGWLAMEFTRVDSSEGALP